jgi:hypothetical protein
MRRTSVSAWPFERGGRKEGGGSGKQANRGLNQCSSLPLLQFLNRSAGQKATVANHEEHEGHEEITIQQRNRDWLYIFSSRASCSSW